MRNAAFSGSEATVYVEVMAEKEMSLSIEQTPVEHCRRPMEQRTSVFVPSAKCVLERTREYLRRIRFLLDTHSRANAVVSIYLVFRDARAQRLVLFLCHVSCFQWS